MHTLSTLKNLSTPYREGLWRIRKGYDIPDKLIRMVRIMYDDFECSALDEGEQSGMV